MILILVGCIILVAGAALIRYRYQLAQCQCKDALPPTDGTPVETLEEVEGGYLAVGILALAMGAGLLLFGAGQTFSIW